MTAAPTIRLRAVSSPSNLDRIDCVDTTSLSSLAINYVANARHLYIVGDALSAAHDVTGIVIVFHSDLESQTILQQFQLNNSRLTAAPLSTIRLGDVSSLIISTNFVTPTSFKSGLDLYNWDGKFRASTCLMESFRVDSWRLARGVQCTELILSPRMGGSPNGPR